MQELFFAGCFLHAGLTAVDLAYSAQQRFSSGAPQWLMGCALAAIGAATVAAPSGHGVWSMVFSLACIWGALVAVYISLTRRVEWPARPELAATLVILLCLQVPLAGQFQSNEIAALLLGAGSQFAFCSLLLMRGRNRSLNAGSLVILTLSAGLGAAGLWWEAWRQLHHADEPYIGSSVMTLAAIVGMHVGWLLSRRDLTEAELKRAADEDGLTGLGNRRALLRFANREIERLGRVPSSMAVLLLDLDHFKQVNDRFGHALGDQVLQDVAAAMRSVVRSVDFTARLGGEEFCILLPDCGPVEAQHVMLRLRTRLIEREGVASAVRIRFSAGISICRSATESFDQVLARADRALYRAKDQGRDRICLGLLPAQ